MLDRIRDNARATELLDAVFDFDLARNEHGEPVRLAAGGDLVAIAGDGSGGTFFVCDDGPVLYASSEGTAGVLGASLTEALQVMVAIPVWQDVAGHAPDLDAMRAAFESSYAGLTEFMPAIDERRTEVSTLLGLDQLATDEALDRLRASLTLDYKLLLVSDDPIDDGNEYEPL
nr:hypothetical protein [Kibdelosporangium sp. MJ126-NF4]CEL18522.1 hypothetical protein [Kibdelosporangium sp. MJ126-NF4]CTQ98006.1 hypothetical protein [Kibdelosporangium sp. MJ126-NF4]